MKKIAFLITILFVFPLVASPESRIVAVINKDVISKRDLENRLKLALLSSGLKDTAANRKELREQILHAMIDETLQIQSVEAADIVVSEEEINDAISHMEQASGSPKGSARKLLKANHIPEATLENQARAHLGWVERLRGKYISMIQITDEEVQRELKKLQGEQQQTQYHIAEIILPIDDQISESKAKRDISKLREDIIRGAHFSAVAQQFSHSATAARGGDLGWQTEDQLSPEFMNVLNSLRPGQISQPIRLSRGYALILYIARQRPGEAIDTEVSMLQVQIPFPFLPTDYEVEETTQKLAMLGKKARSCSSFRKAVERIEGNKIVDSGVMSVSHLNKEILQLIKGLKPGEISEILPTEEGAITFMVCSRKVITPEEWTENSVRNMLIQRKLQLLSRRDLRDLKRDAFIQIR